MFTSDVIKAMCMLRFNDVNYHKFSHGAASYMLNGRNVNVMLEYSVNKNSKEGYVAAS